MLDYFTPGSRLGRQIRRDQLEALRRSLLIALPVNIILGVVVVLVCWAGGDLAGALAWFAVSSTVNILRLALTLTPIRDGEAKGTGLALPTLWYGLLHVPLALLSGAVWGAVGVLCDYYTAPDAVFYLTIVCGISAGAVTTGTSYSAVPIAFTSAALLIVALTVGSQPGYFNTAVGVTTIVYLAAMILSARLAEQRFSDLSRLRHEAGEAVRSLEDANATAQALADEMQYRATHDDITGLLNRSGFSETLGRGEQAMLLVDLDRFKTINDTFGHAAGDRTLVEVGERLHTVLPEGARIGRLGGDEFAVLLGAGVSDADAMQLARAVVAAVSLPYRAFPAGTVGASVGVGHLVGADLDAALNELDAALYAAKRAGGNRVVAVDGALKTQLVQARDAERDLGSALERGEVEMWFQPIVRAADGAIDSLEALLRWRHPVHGYIPPEQILEVSRRAGLSERLFRFVVERGCRMALMLDAAGCAAVRVCINVAAQEARSLSVESIVPEVARGLGVAPQRLEVEITEQAFLDLDQIAGRLTELRQAGVTLAIDDFGVGHSSLAALQKLQVDRVKIDKSFVEDLPNSPMNRGLIASIMHLKSAVGVTVVAEGVETAAELGAVRALGCDYAQGYHFARPEPAEAAMVRLRQGAMTP